MKEINSLLNFISETTQSKYNSLLIESIYKNNIFIQDNKILIDLSKCFYKFQKASFQKEFIFGFSFETPYLCTTIEEMYSKLFFDLNQIFERIIDKELINFTQQLVDSDLLYIKLHIIARIPILSFIFNYIDQDKIKERNIIKDKFEYLLYNLILNLDNFNPQYYFRYLNKFIALYYMHFIFQIILNEILNLFLYENLEKIDLKKNFKLEFYYLNFLSEINKILNIPEQLLMKLNLVFIQQFIKENIYQFSEGYLKLINFKKVIENSVFLKNRINKYIKINSLIDLINSVNFQIRDNLTIEIEFNKLKRYLKNSGSKFSFKKRKL